MEPTQEPVDVYIIRTTIVNMAEEWVTVGSRRDNDNQVIMLKESRGYYVHFDGSWEKLYLGHEQPTLRAGDEVEIRIRKVKDALPR